MSRRSARPPDRDSLLQAVGSLRDLVEHGVQTASWRFTLACAFACASRFVPVPGGDDIARALLLLCAMGLGALTGKRFDVPKYRRP
jgi:hypothetical protein